MDYVLDEYLLLLDKEAFEDGEEIPYESPFQLAEEYRVFDGGVRGVAVHKNGKPWCYMPNNMDNHEALMRAQEICDWRNEND